MVLRARESLPSVMRANATVNQTGATANSDLFFVAVSGAHSEMLKVRVLLTLNEAEDQMSGTDKVEIINPDGSVISLPAGNTPYTRIKFEPFN
jgi:hypothetical protein